MLPYLQEPRQQLVPNRANDLRSHAAGAQVDRGRGKHGRDGPDTCVESVVVHSPPKVLRQRSV